MDDIIDLPDTAVDAVEEEVKSVTSLDVLLGYARSSGDISATMSEEQLTRLGSDVVSDYDLDLKDREDWERVVKDALKKASQEEKRETKTYPWHNASDVNYPLLTVAGLQFNARAYPAIVKGDEAVSCKVVGADKGQPAMQPGPNGNVVPLVDPQTNEPVWQREPGAKSAKAKRVRTFLNTTIFYRMDDWEADTDMLLMQLPIVGCAFRKIWYDGERDKHCAALVHALNLVVPQGAKSCKTSPRLTEKLPDQYPYAILAKMRSGYYRTAKCIEGDEFDKEPRLLLEQHRLIDLDGDGYPEPYIVTVDHQSQDVLRVVANFGPDDVQVKDGRVIRIDGRSFYVKYEFFPHPEGKFYGIGLGHLLKAIGGVIDTAINQLTDAATAQTAGGGWIASGVRLQGSKRSSRITFAPGEYKTVDIPGNQLREGIVERTYPNISPVTFQLLELMLGAAKDIASVKDVITGEAKNTGQVGTTLALIEQGLQVFTAIYKRVYRSLKEEFQLLFDNIRMYANDQTRADYLEVLDDPEADFDADFSATDMDIRPVSDPSSVTKMQSMARANFLMQFVAAPGVNPQAIYKRVWEAADVEDIDELLIPPQPGPSPMEEAEMAKTASEVKKNDASANKDNATAEKLKEERDIMRLEALAGRFSEGVKMGMAA